VTSRRRGGGGGGGRGGAAAASADLAEVVGGRENLVSGERHVLLASGDDEHRVVASRRSLDVRVRLGAQRLDLAAWTCRPATHTHTQSQHAAHSDDNNNYNASTARFCTTLCQCQLTSPTSSHPTFWGF